MPTARSWWFADRSCARDGFLIFGFSPQNQRYNRRLGVLTMPIYEYRCTKCGHQEEFLQKASEPALSKCPACGKSTFQKLLSAAGLLLYRAALLDPAVQHDLGAGVHFRRARPVAATAAGRAADRKLDRLPPSGAGRDLYPGHRFRHRRARDQFPRRATGGDVE